MRPFADVIREVHHGITYAELTEAVARLAAAVIDTRKPGSIKLELKIRPNGEKAVFTTATVTTKIPSRTIGETIFFVDEDGALVREDPRQQRLPLQAVGQPEKTQEQAHG